MSNSMRVQRSVIRKHITGSEPILCAGLFYRQQSPELEEEQIWSLEGPSDAVKMAACLPNALRVSSLTGTICKHTAHIRCGAKCTVANVASVRYENDMHTL